MNKSLISEMKAVNRGSGKAVLVGFLEELLHDFQRRLEEKMQGHVDGETEALLGWEAYQRRKTCGYRQGSATCRGCGSRRRRVLQTLLGEIEVWYPRGVCECGGSVELPLSLVGRYQRFWADVDAQLEQ